MVWALVAGSALFWGLKLGSRPLPVPPQAQVVEPGVALRGDLSRLLGADAPAAAADAAPTPAADSRFALIGVVSPKPPKASREGLALIAVDGKPARAYRVGAVIEGTHVLKDVSARGATLALKGSDAQVALSIPSLAPAATGTLPPAGAAAPMPPPVPAPRALPYRPPGQAAPALPHPMGSPPSVARPELTEPPAIPGGQVGNPTPSE